MTDDRCGHPTANDEPCSHPACRPDGKCWIHTEHDPSDQGRDPKLTLERQEQICGEIEAGKSVKSAARMAGVHPATVYSWLEKGEDQDEGIYADFRDRFVRARGHGEDYYVRTALEMAEAEADLATLMSMLKQRYPESWGEVDRGQQSGGVVIHTGEPDEFEIDEDTLEVERTS